MLNVEDPEPQPEIVATQLFPEERVSKEAVEIVPVDEKALLDEEKRKKKEREAQEKADNQLLVEEKKFIGQRFKTTHKRLDKREVEIRDLINRKQERSKKEFEMKRDVLQSSFKASVDSLVKRVRKQKDLITSSYGPIVLNSKKVEKPIFDINPELDPEGHALMRSLTKVQEQLPQTILVKLKMARCLKDKISSGNFLVIVHALDRLGGNRIDDIDAKRTEESYRILSRNLRMFALKKRAFLNSENRQVQTRAQDGQMTYTAAKQTGIGFFKPSDLEAQ